VYREGGALIFRGRRHSNRDRPPADPATPVRAADTDPPAPKKSRRRRRGVRLQPLPIFALCLVIAVISVILTRTVGLPGRSAGTGAIPATGADTGEGTGEDGSEGTGGEGGDEGTGGEAGIGGPDESPAAGRNGPDDRPPAGNPPGARQPAPRPQRPPVAPKPVPKPQQPKPPPAPAPPPPPSVPPSIPPPDSTPPSPAPAPPVGYEAESTVNSFTSTARVVTCAPCSGGKKVGRLGRDAGTLRFNEVRAGTDGKVEITITYVNGDKVARSADLSVDGADPVAVTFPVTGGWNTVATVRVTIPLKAGANAITFSGKGPAPDLDKISLSSG
jgi:hypothetical protein